MSGRDPIDFDSPLGISKREWTKVLGANLALLLLAYCVALVFTLCGNGAFFVSTENESIERLANVLNSWNVYPLVTIAFATIEETIMIWFIMLKRPKWWIPLTYFAVRVATNLIVGRFMPAVPPFIYLSINAIFCIVAVATFKRKFVKPLIRFAIALAASLLLNELIGLFRTKIVGFDYKFSDVVFVYLSIEYDLAFGLALAFLALLIPWEKGGKKQWSQTADAGGSSPISKRWSLKNSAKKNNLNPKVRKKIILLKAKVIVIQTVALVTVAAFPIIVGKPIEFALLYLAFCLTRVILGFSHSLHFKSELACVTIGALTFWGLTFLAPSAEASIILSLAYGAGLALGFRLWWELHDLMMYRKAAKTDRYAMFYTAFKGNLDPRHIRGVMRLRGFSDEGYIKAVQMYMAKEKVDYIADWLSEPLRSVDRKLTEIADELYRLR